jgi:hypothetical protein
MLAGGLFVTSIEVVTEEDDLGRLTVRLTAVDIPEVLEIDGMVADCLLGDDVDELKLGGMTSGLLIDVDEGTEIGPKLRLLTGGDPGGLPETELSDGIAGVLGNDAEGSGFNPVLDPTAGGVADGAGDDIRDTPIVVEDRTGGLFPVDVVIDTLGDPSDRENVVGEGGVPLGFEGSNVTDDPTSGMELGRPLVPEGVTTVVVETKTEPDIEVVVTTTVVSGGNTVGKDVVELELRELLGGTGEPGGGFTIDKEGGVPVADGGTGDGGIVICSVDETKEVI